MDTTRTDKKDKIEVVNLLILAIVSSAVGFCLVFFFFSPDKREAAAVAPSAEPAETEAPPAEPTDPAAQAGEPAPAEGGGYAPAGSEGGGYDVSAAPRPAPTDPAVEPGNAPDQGADGRPEVPPGRTPSGVSIDGKAFYLKCWDPLGNQHPGASCDRLNVLEKRFSTRLYVVDRCKKRYAESAQGKVSLGMEVDYKDNSIRFWNGASSDIKGASRIGTCIREELSGLPISGFNHKYERYRIFFTVVFGKAEPAVPDKVQSGDSGQAARKQAGAKGRPVNVIKDRVRVRKTPKDGEIIGKISSGNQVKLLKKKAGWCNIVTPNGNEGWMICDALDL